MRSDSWPSPRRSQRSARLRLRPCEEGRRFFQELVLHPQPADLVFHFLHAGALHRIQVRNGLRIITPPQVEPVAQRALVDPQVAGDLGDGLAGLEHHLHGLGPELRAEPPPLLWHGQILSAESHCPRSLVHPSGASSLGGDTPRWPSPRSSPPARPTCSCRCSCRCSPGHAHGRDAPPPGRCRPSLPPGARREDAVVAATPPRRRPTPRPRDLLSRRRAGPAGPGRRTATGPAPKALPEPRSREVPTM